MIFASDSDDGNDKSFFIYVYRAGEYLQVQMLQIILFSVWFLKSRLYYLYKDATLLYNLVCAHFSVFIDLHIG